MSFFTRIFGFLRDETVYDGTTPEYARMEEYARALADLLRTDDYLSHKDYGFLDERYKDVYDFFHGQQQAKTLKYYCEQNRLNRDLVIQFLHNYEDLKKPVGAQLVRTHNEDYIRRHLQSEKSYLDNILRDVDPAIRLDEEQRRVVLSDEDYTLVVAGAGAGKTTTMAAKVRYLVDRRHVDPKQILVISYTNKAVKELQDKINKQLHLPCPVTTFHKTGYAILRKQDEERRRVVDNGFLFNVINNYLKQNVLEQPDLVNKLILFFGAYFEAPYEGDNLNDFFNHISKGDFTTIRGNIAEYSQEVIDRRTGQCVSIAHETMRSREEVRIANFLYLNQVDYEYERPYPYYIKQAHKPYTPDFTLKQGDKIIYLEHFGITEDGRNSRYNAETLKRYKQSVNDKIRFHRQHGSELIYTFSAYKDGRDTLTHLREKLEQIGIQLTPRPSLEVFEKIVNTEENKYILKLVALVCQFITNFKTQGYTIEHFSQMERQSNNMRTKLFLQICEQCFLEYSRRLKERDAIDFEDMINDSARILLEQKAVGDKLNFKYIIIDEYQDISRQRFDLARNLSDICDAKIVAVGDDWQSIYAYAGSDITLFTRFAQTMGYADMQKITRTYRNSQQIINVAGRFVQKNPEQLRKDLVSSKRLEKPVQIFTYSEQVDRKKYEGRGGRYFLIGKTVETILDRIMADEKQAQGSILLLGRYGFDAYNLCKSNDFIYDEKTGGVYSRKYPQKHLEFLTVHRAKGLGYDNVILINARNETYGFPTQVQDDPILRLVTQEDRAIDYAEERRLFYVALTRTKNRVYILVPEERPSSFIMELLKENPQDAQLIGKFSKHIKETHTDLKPCPICGYPLQLRYRPESGLRLWLCTNEPEVCDFMTNDLHGGKMTILKCDQCRDGYLIIKPGKNGPFLGCTNYKSDGTGCSRMMTPLEYAHLCNPVTKVTA